MSSSRTPKSKIVILRLSPDLLAKFPHSTPSSVKPSLPSKSSSSPETSAAQAIAEPSPAADTPADSASAAATKSTAINDADTPSDTLAPPGAGPAPKKKGIPGPKPGSKRGATVADGVAKPRGKPGPKKKQKLGDMINDPNNKGPFAAPAPIQRLGPKANQGAINAGLRALDRTGKPCRKWEKKGFQLRSFTGVNWLVPTWRAPKNSAAFSEDVKSDSTGSSDAKMKDESSAISEKSGVNGDGSTPVPLATNGIASSPVPVAATS